MGTTIHFPQSACEDAFHPPQSPPADGPDARPETAELFIPAGAADEPPAGPEPGGKPAAAYPPRPLSGWKPAVSAALWGLAAAGVLLGCREAAEMGEWFREAVLWAVSLLAAGWCGLSPAGQPGIVLILLLRAMAAGAAAAAAWQGGDPQAAVAALVPYALSLTLLISEASDGMMASFRVVRRLRGGKAAGAGKYLLRTGLRILGAGIVWAAWAWGTGRI